MNWLRILTSALLLVASAVALADEPDLAAVSVLHPNLEQVVEIGTVAPVGGLTSTGQPDKAALEVFVDSGYVAVVDLRGPDENRGFDEQAYVEELGMFYESLPIPDAGAVNLDNAEKLDEILGRFDGPVLVHCGSGNRVGALLALRSHLHGASDENAIAYGREAGMTRLEGTVQERLDAAGE